MKCPKCGATMEYSKGENEDLEGNLIPYSYYFCAVCANFVHDWEDEFEWPEESDAH